MLKGNWRGHIALGGIAAAAFLVLTLVLYLPQSPWNIEKNRQQQQAQTEYPKDEDAALESRIWLGRILENGRPQIAAKDGENTNAKVEDYTTALDLRAQWSTAIATAEMVSLTRLQILFSILGLIALGYTLYLTRESVRAANRTADEAKLSSERQLRAYVNIFHAWIDWKGHNPPRAKLKIKNFGSTPAYKMKAWIGTAVGETAFGNPPSDLKMGVFDLGPTAEYELDSDFGQVLENKKIEIMTRKVPIFVWGKITYTDAFKEKRETVFRLSMPMHDGADHSSVGLEPCENGNHST